MGVLDLKLITTYAHGVAGLDELPYGSILWFTADGLHTNIVVPAHLFVSEGRPNASILVALSSDCRLGALSRVNDGDRVGAVGPH